MEAAKRVNTEASPASPLPASRKLPRKWGVYIQDRASSKRLLERIKEIYVKSYYISIWEGKWSNISHFVKINLVKINKIQCVLTICCVIGIS